MKEQIFAAAAMGSALVLALSGQTGTGGVTNTVTTADQKFLQEAVKGNNQEITDAQRQLNSSDPNVRTFAQIMIRDHTAANAKFVALADKDNVKVDKSATVQTDESNGNPGSTTAGSPPPAAMNGTGPAMDPKAYMQREVSDHQQDVALFQGEVQNGRAEDVRTLAKTTLPVLQGHLQMAQQYVQTGKVTPVPTPSPANDSGPRR